MDIKQAIDHVKATPVVGIKTTRVEVPLGSIYWQGDVGFLRVTSTDAPQVPLQAQLAPGATRGSRHIINPESKCVLYRKRERDVAEGPVVEAISDLQVDHPDHGTVILPPGLYQIRYQRQIDDGQIHRMVD